MAQFSRQPVENNQWQPEVCGVDFSERLMKALGELAEKGDIWVTFVTLEGDDSVEPPLPEVTFQVTQENCQVALSHTDDDSDAILLRDPRDGMFFRYLRMETDPKVFDWALETVFPWSTQVGSMVPLEANYKAVLDRLGRDLGGDEEPLVFNPDDWQ